MAGTAILARFCLRQSILRTARPVELQTVSCVLETILAQELLSLCGHGKALIHSSTQELIILFLFSLRFNLSTLFLCILASSCSYLSFSSFFCLFSLIAAILSCGSHQCCARGNVS